MTLFLLLFLTLLGKTSDCFAITFPLRALSVLRPPLSDVSSQRYLLIVQLLSVHRITQILCAARQ
jgi:hypothetical protein